MSQGDGSHLHQADAQEREHISSICEAYSGVPGVVGVIDGTHNVITAPSHQAERYRNRYKTDSFNKMAVCDHNLLIRDLHVGEVGSLHDSRVFRRSPLFRKLLEEDDNDKLLRYDQHILGDKAYALMDSVMVPFNNLGNLTEEERAYNHSLCKSRVRIEHAFGKSFGQWRRMKHLESANVEIAVDHITACFVLHNFMILNGEKLLDLNDPTILLEDYVDVDQINDAGDEAEDEDEDGGNENFNRRVADAKIRGREKRIQLVQHLGL